MCHVAGIGVMAKIFGGKENSDNVLTLLLVKECHRIVVKEENSELLAEQFLSRIVCLVCKCAHYAYSLFFSSWQRPIL